MENNNVPDEPKRKTIKDFALLFLAIGDLFAALILFKYVMEALHLI